MSDKPDQRKRSWAAVIAAVAVLFGLYVGGYFALSANSQTPVVSGPGIHGRGFPHPAVASAYVPVGWIEAKLRGGVVVLTGSNGPDVGISHIWLGEGQGHDPPPQPAPR